MTTTKFEIEKFDGNGDFTSWTRRITTIFGSQKTLKALEDPKELPATLTKSERETLEEVAYGTLVMNITDNMLRQGAKSEAAILINSIHETYKEVKTALKYGRETITVNSVITTLKSKELELKTENKTSNAAEGKNFRRDENKRYRPYGREDFNRNRNYQREDRRRGREHGSDHGLVGNEAFKYTEVLVATNKKAWKLKLRRKTES
ncbi:Retrovirus-related Pol polyprotein from transposon TNT 1-94 [Cucumis melo var. makuwa]|uniref:Retrovirus-related Pol polyprotein from transposon TNT 1-94 n=1 Tax=Cucumis melo var. makuwa TaxID=1194695 RepID=A0A5D3DST2_CUCMM|nr:Retrovirus-related Pol polyprotein from transposon TNT 1-94 [Cucumis melo var. makuwa]TYK26827.1 Retrovirus-related Pol polyprotein from transposon TNT 1-94 [Cucumis melo var. makuwa]